MPDVDVQPAQGSMGNNPAVPSQPQVQPQPEAAPPPPEAAAPSLPPDVLSIHAIQGLLAGAPAAASMDISQFSKTEDGKVLAANGDALKGAGLGFYKALSGDTGVIFNQLYLHPQDLQAADKMGKLSHLAPPWTKVDHAIAKAGAAHPAFNHRGAPGGIAAATPPPPPQAATGAIQPPGKALPAKAQSELLAARIAAQNPPGPTQGPAAGQSQLLARVLKPVV